MKDELVQDEVMIKAKREWRVGILVFVLFVLILGGVGWGYWQINDQTPINNNQTIAANNQVQTTNNQTIEPKIQMVKPVFAVWNGSGVAGAAGILAEKLKSDGYEVVEIKNAPSQLGNTLSISRSLMRESESVISLLAKLGFEGHVNNLDSDLEYSVKIIIGK